MPLIYLYFCEFIAFSPFLWLKAYHNVRFSWWWMGRQKRNKQDLDICSKETFGNISTKDLRISESSIAMNSCLSDSACYMLRWQCHRMVEFSYGINEAYGDNWTPFSPLLTSPLKSDLLIMELSFSFHLPANELAWVRPLNFLLRCQQGPEEIEVPRIPLGVKGKSELVPNFFWHGSGRVYWTVKSPAWDSVLPSA